VHVVPAEVADRELVHPQLARVEQAEQLDPLEARLAQRAELVGAELAHVPGVVGLLRAGRREREQVRRRDVGGAARPQDRAEVVEHGLRVLEVLDRLEEDDRVARLRVRLDEVAREADAGPRVLDAGVLVRLGVRVDAHGAGGALGEHRRPVALAAGHVDHVEAAAALGHPAVDRQVAAVPVVLGRHVRERPLARQAERRDPRRLVLLRVARERGQGGGRRYRQVARSRPDPTPVDRG
jgi:hypothetical protein